MERKRFLPSVAIISSAAVLASFLVVSTIFGASIPSSVTVGNAAPTVSSVVVNGGSSITLTPNTTTAVSVTATIADNNGCGDVTGGTTTVLLYRANIGSSTCLTSQSSLNCYLATAFTASSSCAGNAVNTTTTFNLQYFAQATDGSSTFSGVGWRATVVFKDPSNATGSFDSATTTLNSLTAINITTSSINYGTLAASSTSGGTNQTTTITNAGNTSTTLQLSGTALVSGGTSIATSSQHYATSTFTYGGGEQLLSGSAAAVSGFLLTAPTSTTNVAGTIFWGVSVPAGSPTGTYTGTSTFTSVYST